MNQANELNNGVKFMLTYSFKNTLFNNSFTNNQLFIIWSVLFAK